MTGCQPILEAEDRLAACPDDRVFRLALLATGSVPAAEAAHAARLSQRKPEAR